MSNKNRNNSTNTDAKSTIATVTSKSTEKHEAEFDKSVANCMRELNLCQRACQALDFVSANYHQALAINSAANLVRLANSENSDPKWKPRAQGYWEQSLMAKSNSDICQTQAENPEARAKAKLQAKLAKLQAEQAKLQAEADLLQAELAS